MAKGIYQRKIKRGGWKLSEETKKKFSEVRKKRKEKLGYLNSPEARQKVSEALRGRPGNNLGKKFSPETRQKMSNAQKGRENPFQKGGKNNFWKGGITPINQKIRSSIGFRLWREAVFERDKFLCQMPDCDKIERYLNAHHIKKFSDYSELRFEINNGITLCKKCHNKTKWKEEQFEQLFLEINHLK